MEYVNSKTDVDIINHVEFNMLFAVSKISKFEIDMLPIGHGTVLWNLFH